MPTKAQWGMILASLAYFALAFACLRQWGSTEPWARVDVFAGGFLGLLILSTIFELGLGLPTLRSTAALRDASGAAYDTATLVTLAFLSTVDFLVFLGYGRWHLIPALQRAVLQSTGLFLTIVAIAWLLRTDTLLARYFAKDLHARRILKNGPFRYVRHPRYAGALAIRFAFALVYASAVGWLLGIVWTILLLRRIRLEEQHLRLLYGKEYDLYAERTPRLIPGIY